MYSMAITATWSSTASRAEGPAHNTQNPRMTVGKRKKVMSSVNSDSNPLFLYVIPLLFLKRYLKHANANINRCCAASFDTTFCGAKNTYMVVKANSRCVN